MTKLLDLFQKIYIINLASRADRRVEMREQLQRVGLSFESSNVELFEAVRPESAGEFPSIGARGCFMSHLQILRKSATAGLDRVLILEDDLNFNDDFAQREEAAARALRGTPWGVFYGGYQLQGGLTAAPGYVELKPEATLGCTHFIGFQGAAIQKAVRYLEAMAARPAGDPNGGPMHVDGAYAWFRRAHPELSTLMAVPELGYQRFSRTDIHDLRWYDRIIGIRTLAAMVRSTRN